MRADIDPKQNAIQAKPNVVAGQKKAESEAATSGKEEELSPYAEAVESLDLPVILGGPAKETSAVAENKRLQGKLDDIAKRLEAPPPTWNGFYEAFQKGNIFQVMVDQARRKQMGEDNV